MTCESFSPKAEKCENSWERVQNTWELITAAKFHHLRSIYVKVLCFILLVTDVILLALPTTDSWIESMIQKSRWRKACHLVPSQIQRVREIHLKSLTDTLSIHSCKGWIALIWFHGGEYVFFIIRQSFFLILFLDELWISCALSNGTQLPCNSSNHLYCRTFFFTFGTYR